jgi:hypothetical protein
MIVNNISGLNDFEKKLDQWLIEVSDGCHDLAILKEDYPDFYVFQSKIRFSPDLLIVGANPGGCKTYASILKDKNIYKRSKNDLANGTNLYLQNPNWSISRPILEMFSSERLKHLLETSVIMNTIFFNTTKVADLNKLEHGKEMISFCIKKSNELIYDILKPKNILFIGDDSARWLGLKFTDDSSVLRNEKTYSLIKYVQYKGISHYKIHHTSMNFSFNTGDNLEMKKKYFERNLAMNVAS